MTSDRPLRHSLLFCLTGLAISRSNTLFDIVSRLSVSFLLPLLLRLVPGPTRQADKYLVLAVYPPFWHSSIILSTTFNSQLSSELAFSRH